MLTDLRSGINLELPDHYDAVSDMRDGAVTTAVRFEPDENGLSAWWVSFADDPGGESAGTTPPADGLRNRNLPNIGRYGNGCIRAAHPTLQRVANELPNGDSGDSDHSDMMKTLSTLSDQESEFTKFGSLAWRIGANKAYHDLVFERLVQLRAHGRDESVGGSDTS